MVPLPESPTAMINSNAKSIVPNQRQSLRTNSSQLAESCSSGVKQLPKSLTKQDNVVSLALKESSLPAFLLPSERLSFQVMSGRRDRLKRHPTRTKSSPTTLRAGSSARGPGLPSLGGPSGKLLPRHL